MFGITFSYNGIFIGIVIGFLVGVTSNSVAAGIVVAIIASVACVYGIRALEKLLGHGISAGAKAVEKSYNRRNNQGEHR